MMGEVSKSECVLKKELAAWPRVHALCILSGPESFVFKLEEINICYSSCFRYFLQAAYS